MHTLRCGQIGGGVLLCPTEYTVCFRNLEEKTCFHHKEVQNRYILLDLRNVGIFCNIIT